MADRYQPSLFYMNKKELLKALDVELNALRYYAYYPSRKSMTINSSLYDEFVPIGYTKRPMILSRRCAPIVLTSNEKININTKLEDIYIIYEFNDKNKNKYTPLELFWILYPDRREEIIINLNSEQSKVKPIL